MEKYDELKKSGPNSFVSPSPAKEMPEETFKSISPEFKPLKESTEKKRKVLFKRKITINKPERTTNSIFEDIDNNLIDSSPSIIPINEESIDNDKNQSIQDDKNTGDKDLSVEKNEISSNKIDQNDNNSPNENLSDSLELSKTIEEIYEPTMSNILDNVKKGHFANTRKSWRVSGQVKVTKKKVDNKNVENENNDLSHLENVLERNQHILSKFSFWNK